MVQAAEAEDPRLVDCAVCNLALEIAELGWQVRRARARRTAVAAKLSGQRIRALARVAGLVLTRARSGLHHQDEPPAELVERLRELFLQEVETIANDTVGPTLAVDLMAKVRARLDGAGNAVELDGEVEVRTDL